MAANSGYAQDKAIDLAKKSQNPVSDLISVPFQNNFHFGHSQGIRPIFKMKRRN